MRSFIRKRLCINLFASFGHFVTHRIVVSGGTSGTLSSCKNMHLTVVRKHRHLAGHCATARPVEKAARRMTNASITLTTKDARVDLTARRPERD